MAPYQWYSSTMVHVYHWYHTVVQWYVHVRTMVHVYHWYHGIPWYCHHLVATMVVNTCVRPRYHGTIPVWYVHEYVLYMCALFQSESCDITLYHGNKNVRTYTCTVHVYVRT